MLLLNPKILQGQGWYHVGFLHLIKLEISERSLINKKKIHYQKPHIIVTLNRYIYTYAYPKYTTTFRIRKDSSFDRENIIIQVQYWSCEQILTIWNKTILELRGNIWLLFLSTYSPKSYNYDYIIRNILFKPSNSIHDTDIIF